MQMTQSKHLTGFGGTVACAVTLALALTMTLPSDVSAKVVQGSVTIDPGGHYGWRMDVAIPSQIEYQIRSVNGVQVDVLVMDENNYSEYSDGKDFSFFGEYSCLDTLNVSSNFTVLSGSVFVVVDNSDRPSQTTNVAPTEAAKVEFWVGSTFDLHAVPGGGPSWFVYAVLAGVATMFVVVVFLTRKAAKGRKREAQSSKRALSNGK